MAFSAEELDVGMGVDIFDPNNIVVDGTTGSTFPFEWSGLAGEMEQGRTTERANLKK